MNLKGVLSNNLRYFQHLQFSRLYSSMRRVESTEYADYPSPQFTLQFARFLFGLSYKATCKAGALPEGERGGGGGVYSLI